MTLRSQTMVSNSSGSKSHSATHVYAGYSRTLSEPWYCHLQNRDTSVWICGCQRETYMKCLYIYIGRRTFALPSASIQKHYCHRVSFQTHVPKQRLRFVQVQYVPFASCFHLAPDISRNLWHFLSHPYIY